MFKYLLLFITLFAYSKLGAQGSNTCAGAVANPITFPFFANNQSTCGDLNDYTGINGCVSSIQIPITVVPYPTVILFTN